MSDKGKEMKIAKSLFLIQDLISQIVTRIPFVLEHNIGKYSAIKKAFYLTALENLQGDYFEFGVFTGSSFVCAIRSHKRLAYMGRIDTKFYGFDSFQGFGGIEEYDRHWFYQSNIFKTDKRKVINFIKSKSRNIETKIIDGHFEDTLRNRTCKDIGSNKARIVFIDCDMKKPASLAMEFMKPGLQEGTILIIDDFFSYRGSHEKGVAGAFFEFCRKNKEFDFREVFRYGYGGIAYIVSSIKRKKS